MYIYIINWIHIKIRHFNLVQIYVATNLHVGDGTEWNSKCKTANMFIIVSNEELFVCYINFQLELFGMFDRESSRYERFLISPLAFQPGISDYVMLQQTRIEV